MSASSYVLTDGGTEVVKYPYSIYQMMQDNPNVSFSTPVPDDIAAGFNVFPVTDTPQPQINPMTQNIALVNPVQQDGVWVQTWSVTEATPEQQAARLAAFRASLSCTPLQGKIELNNEGLLDSAESIVLAADKVTQLAWANATIWMRNSPMIETLGTQMGLSADQLDNLFKAARLITV